VTLDRQISNRVVFQAAAGALLFGTIETPSIKRTMTPGALLAASLAWRVLDMNGDGTPFLILTGTFAGFIGATQGKGAPNGNYEAFDLRLGAVFGTVIPIGSASLRPY